MRSTPHTMYHLTLLAGLALAPLTALAQPAATPAAPPQAEAAPTAPAGSVTELAPGAGDRLNVTSGTLALLKRLEGRQSAVRTVHAKFKQVKRDEVFDEEIPSSGELWYDKPNFFRCDYADPEPMITLLDDEGLYIYTPAIKQVDYVMFESNAERDAQLDQLLIAFNFKVDQLVTRYGITSSADDEALGKEVAAAGASEKSELVRIVPQARFAEEAPFTELKVWIDKNTLLPEKIWYLDRMGGGVTVTLDELKLDSDLEAGLFNRKRLFARDAEYVNKRESL